MLTTTDLRKNFLLLVAGSVGSREQFLQSGEGGASFGYFLIRSCASELLSINLHLMIREKTGLRIDSSLIEKHTELPGTGL